MTANTAMNKLAGVLRYFAALAVACTLCAGAMYAIVRYATRDVEVYARPDDRALREAIELRQAMNLLAELTGDFMTRAGDGDAKAFERWLEQDFQPRLDMLRDRLIHGPESYESVRPLIRAADALHVAAASPRDARRREQAAGTVLNAILECERRVGMLGANPNKLPPPVPAPEAGGE